MKKKFTKEDLMAAFYESINYFSPKYGWDKNAFDQWYNKHFLEFSSFSKTEDANENNS
jgi:hypothetical protein